MGGTRSVPRFTAPRAVCVVDPEGQEKETVSAFPLANPFSLVCPVLVLKGSVILADFSFFAT